MKPSNTFAFLSGIASINGVKFGRAATGSFNTLAPREDGWSRENIQYPANYFDQIIDHFPNSSRYKSHDKGTFKQTYYYDYSYYKPGGPREKSLVQPPDRNHPILIQETNGLGVILENRYYGTSFPYNDSTVDHLAYLTTEQTIADNAYFAQNAVFPNVTGNLTAPSTPWILYGGSLAGSQTAFSVKAYGDILYGGIASSSILNVTVGYPSWYAPIQKYAPSDCVSRINNIVGNFDDLVRANNTVAIQQFKSLFGLESLSDLRDFAMTINFPIGNPGSYDANTWQELNWNPTYGSDDFFQFCGNVTNIDPAEEIRQVDFTLSNYTNGFPWDGLGGYADYVKKTILPICPEGDDLDSTMCFGTQNETFWADTTSGSLRSYTYSSCTEQGAYIDSPRTGPTLLSRVVDTSYEQQWCTWAFPPGKYNSIPPSPDTTQYLKYGGFNISAPRLAFIDGDQDVWKDLGYHSDFAPARVSTSENPEYLITGAGHHWDSYGILDVEAEPQFIREAHKWEIRTVKTWLKDFESWKKAR